jgi:prefoldin subunit 5
MAEKTIDSTTKILRKIQSELAEFRREVNARFDEVNQRFDKLEELVAGAAVTSLDARGIAERLKERVKRLETRRE